MKDKWQHGEPTFSRLAFRKMLGVLQLLGPIVERKAATGACVHDNTNDAGWSYINAEMALALDLATKEVE